eukprot:m.573385 g.573385  ORF g.573385 m.573385 type:complete len:69 (+) comp57877_c0_seq9:278-484(+)
MFLCWCDSQVMQVWYLSGLANSIKQDYETMHKDFTRAKELFIKHDCEEPDLLTDMDALMAQHPVQEDQ